MIKSMFGISKEPFIRSDLTLLPQQKHILDIINIHSQQGGFSVVIGQPGTGKSVLREHIEQFEKKRDVTVASCSRTLHTYLNILKQIADSFKVEASTRELEKVLIQTAYSLIRERKTLYILIDEAHLLDMRC